MSRTFAPNFVVAILCVTMCIAYEDDEEQFRDFNDILPHRSRPEKWQSRDDSSEIVKLAMPGVHPTKEDTYLCTAVDLHKKKDYIVAIKPLVNMNTAHHLMVFGCPEPAKHAFASDGEYWVCGEMGSNYCKGSDANILYAWGRNAPELDLPPDTAFEVGGKSDNSYLVLEVHYASADRFLADPTLKDYSGVDVHVTSVRPSQLAAIFVLQPFGDIPPKKEAWHFDIGCRYNDGPVLHPFKFRVHTHGIGTVVVGYRIRDGKWAQIGKMDPQRPQAFYPVDNLLEIKSGDSIAARCTFNSMQRNRVTHSGLTHSDEMCNFYIMYWYDPKQVKGASSPRDLCKLLDPSNLDFPADSDKLLPNKRLTLAMK